MSGVATLATLRPVAELLRILQRPDHSQIQSPTLGDARLVAGEALAQHGDRLDPETHAAVVAGLALLLREAPLPLHQARAAAALLRMGVEEVTP